MQLIDLISFPHIMIHDRSVTMVQEGLDLPTSIACCFICLFLGSCLYASKQQLYDCIISILRTTSVILVNGGLLVVHPPELRFPAVGWTSCSMELTNKTGRYVAFQAKSTRTMGAYVTPSKGVILPKSTCIVTVAIGAYKEITLKDSVIIRSIVVEDKTKIVNVSNDKFDKAFAIVEEVKLKAGYELTSPLSGALYESDKRSPETSNLVDAVARFNHRSRLDRARETTYGILIKRFFRKCLAFAVSHFQEPANAASKGVEYEVDVQSDARERQNSGGRHEASKQLDQKPTPGQTTALKASNDKIRSLQADNSSLQKEFTALQGESRRVHERLQEAINDRDEAFRGFEELKCRHRAVLEQLRKADGEKLEAKLRIAESEGVARDLESQLQSLRARYDALHKERDDAAREADELRGKMEHDRMGNGNVVREGFRSEFSRSELERATQNFDDTLRIGEGGFGSVYKARLRDTAVAIKVMRAQSSHDLSQFYQEEIILSKVRHPNMVTLIGSCSEEAFFALIYECLPNGSLEDCLRRCSTSSGAAGTTPSSLTWRVRTRIVAEICSALVFLHSVKPNPVVHGDLKPANILLDANMVSKLGDFGTSRLLLEESDSGSMPYRYTQPKGTLHYLDPEFQSTGELTTRSDVYSFGIVVLRLLTGKPALGIAKRVQDALDRGHLRSVMDPSAGAWPPAQSKQLARLALRCCRASRRDRPDLAGEVLGVIEAIMKAA